MAAASARCAGRPASARCAGRPQHLAAEAFSFSSQRCETLDDFRSRHSTPITETETKPALLMDVRRAARLVSSSPGHYWLAGREIIVFNDLPSMRKVGARKARNALVFHSKKDFFSPPAHAEREVDLAETLFEVQARQGRRGRQQASRQASACAPLIVAPLRD